MTYSAVISPCGSYRYRLDFGLEGNGSVACVIMVNPSKADGFVKDATIRKLNGFGSRLNWSRYIVVNKFGYRATDVKELRDVADPVGPMNYHHVLLAMMEADLIVVAWGSLNKLPLSLRGKWHTVARMAKTLKKPLMCWGLCGDGHPWHPVIIGYDNPLTEWSALR